MEMEQAPDRRERTEHGSQSGTDQQEPRRSGQGAAAALESLRRREQSTRWLRETATPEAPRD